MGCDIHMHVEKLEKNGWVYQEQPEIELYYYPDTMSAPAMGHYWYWGRNYSLFTFLAGVRDDAESYLNTDPNHWRAQFRFGDEGNMSLVPPELLNTRNTPLSLPRGLPEDISPEVRKESEKWGPDGHSHSWFTARELQAVDYETSKLIETGLVQDLYPDGTPGRAQEFARINEHEGLEAGWNFLKNTGEGSYCQGTNQEGYRRVAWRAKLRDVLGSDWFDFLDRISKLSIDDGNDVRAVFWFDN